jgi:ABC-type sugar transport system ATPase subunit
LKIRVPSTKTMVRYLSGGQRQAVAIARCVYWNAQLLILDEPTAALGVVESKAVLDLLVALKKYASGILITHNIRHALSVADQVVVLRHGRVLGKVQESKNLTLEAVEDLMEGDII